MADRKTHKTQTAPGNNDPAIDESVAETFPASDPTGHTTSSGARAVSADEMLKSGSAAPPADSTTITARFRDAQSAKLAVEEVVRNGPVDRRATQIRAHDDAVIVQVTASRADSERLVKMLERQGGQRA
jgi:hypothetical protein